jgi:thymidine kinase
MSITLIQGPMFSGKSTTLIKYAVRAKLAKKDYILIKYAGDDRYGDINTLITHDRVEQSAVSVSEYGLPEIDVSRFEYIFIDEGQFFKNIACTVKLWVSARKKVYIAALSSDFNANPWSEISKLGPVENIINLSAICEICGEDAYFTSLTKSSITDANNTVIIGGKDLYRATCRLCFNSSCVSD